MAKKNEITESSLENLTFEIVSIMNSLISFARISSSCILNLFKSSGEFTLGKTL